MDQLLGSRPLPSGERKFIDLIVNHNFVAYGVGFAAEQTTLAHLSNHFRQLNQFANIALLRVGSGGRFEGAGLGDTEFVLLTKDSMGEGWICPPDDQDGCRVYPHQYFQKLSETTGSDIFGVGLTPYMKVVLEHKKIDGTEPLSYHPDSNTPYPGRILEGEYIAGNPALVEEARRKVFAEITSSPEIVAGMKKDLKVHKKVCEKGLSRKTPQFDAKDNVLFFDPPARQFGMKYGLLRYVQTALSIELFELFQRKQFPIDEYLDLPPSVEERIRFAFRKGWVANEEDLIIAGLIYLQMTEVNCTAKIQYYTDDTKTVFTVQNGAIKLLNADIVSIFQNRLLID